MVSKGSWSCKTQILVERDRRKHLSKQMSTIISSRHKCYEENNIKVRLELLSSAIYVSSMWLFSTWKLTSLTVMCSQCKICNRYQSLSVKRREWKCLINNFILINVLKWHFGYILLSLSRSVVSDSLRPYELQHTRLPCPSPSLGVYSNSCPLSQWCHPTISSSVIPFSSCPQYFPASLEKSSELALHIKWPKYSDFSFSIRPSNEYSGLISFKIDWFDLLAAQGTVKSLLQHYSPKASALQCSAFFTVQLSIFS